MILISTCWEAAAAFLRQDEAKAEAEKAEKREDTDTLGIHPDTQIQINTNIYIITDLRVLFTVLIVSCLLCCRLYALLTTEDGPCRGNLIFPHDASPRHCQHSWTRGSHL